ncbi:MAG: c-type cytochrome, partial [Verrucomicrobiae bacterium]|nr:c-type cytochrome [Verrucomicrobiae bacterium]
DGTDRAFIAATVRATHLLRGSMPRFAGTKEESEKIAEHIFKHIDKRPLGEIYKLEGVALGRKAYEVRCGRCHVLGGYGDKTKSFAKQSAEDFNTMLDMAAELGAGMPAYTGNTAERKALISFLLTLANPKAQ